MRMLMMVGVLALAQDPGLPEAVKKAQAKLETSPDDADSNATVGRHLAFEKGDFETGLRMLAKGSDGFLKSLAEKDLAGPKDSSKTADLGDDWAEGISKRPGLRAGMQDRAAFWYRKAWVAAEGAAREKLRARFRKMASPPADYEKPGKPGGSAGGWDVPADYWKSSLESGFAHSGRQCAKILPAGKDNASGISGFNSLALPAPARKYVASAWVFSDHSDADGSFTLRFFDAAGKQLASSGPLVPVDSPFWQKLSVEADGPADAVRVTVNFSAKLKTGAIWVDDVSIKGEGRELLKNGGFEEK